MPNQPNVRLVLPNKADPTDPKNLEAIERWAQNFVVNQIVAGTGVTITQQTPAIGKGATGQGIVTINATATGVSVTVPAVQPVTGTYRVAGVATNGNWIVGGSTGMSVSANSGVSWTNTQPSAFNCFGLSVNGNNVLAIGSATAITVAFLYSTNGGTTWSSVGTVGAAIGSLNQNPRACLWLGSNWWVCSGTLVTNLYFSSNNGSTWSTVAMPAPIPANPSVEPVWLVSDGASYIGSCGVNAQTGSGFGYAYSGNAGSTWTAPPGSGASIVGGSWLTTASSMLGCENSGSGNLQALLNLIVMTATNTVTVLSPVASAIRAAIYGVYAISAKGAIGGTSATGYGSFAWTDNGGNSWNQPSTPPLTTVNDIAWITTTSALLVGTGGFNAPVCIVNGMS